MAIDSAELAKVPKTTVSLDEHTSFQALRMIDRLEEMDDVQNVSHNVELTDEIMEKYQSQVK